MMRPMCGSSSATRTWRSDEGSDVATVAAELKEELANVDVRLHEHEENRVLRDHRDDRKAAWQLEHRRRQKTAPSGEAEIIGCRDNRRDVCGDFFGREPWNRLTIDQQAVAAEHDRSVNPLTLANRRHKITNGGHLELRKIAGRQSGGRERRDGCETSARVGVKSSYENGLHARVPDRILRHRSHMSASVGLRRKALTIAGAVVIAVGLANTSACGPSNASAFEDAFDTLTLYAINGTSANDPSAIDMASAAAVIPTGACQFDYAFDINAQNSAVIYPVKFVCTDLGAVTRNVGLQRSQLAFDSIYFAPTQGYIFDSAMVLIPGKTILLASQAPGCVTYSDPAVYGELVLDSVNLATRAIYVRAKIDPNCGYRSFLPGFPSR
jgi:hypothetical protein